MRFNSYNFTSLNDKFNNSKKLNKSLIDELINDINNIIKLIGLNDYVNEIKIRF